ncbi:hypothetical protein L7F22_033328 [Adiantum nelumboides]|nr:hypothetical protein [Adiantum nelumboides]
MSDRGSGPRDGHDGDPSEGGTGDEVGAYDRSAYDDFGGDRDGGGGRQDGITYGGDRWAEGGFGDAERADDEPGDTDDGPDPDGAPDRSDERPEGEGEIHSPEDTAQDAVLAHVLNEIRGGETPDVVPAQSTVAGFAEFLAVDAALDRRWPESVMEPSLDRIQALCDALGDPQRAYPVVHLTGTNGKTSTARMVDALLTEIGLRTGRYTSPHLQRATERINLDNRPITAERFVEVYREVEPFVELIDAKAAEGEPAMSKFEVLTAMGFAAFADAPVEAAVVEVGLGGRWDATNVADAHVAVILPIGLDHAELPGQRRPGHREGEGRDHQARLDRRARRAGQGRRRGADRALRRGRRGGRPRGGRVRRPGARARRRRATPGAAGPVRRFDEVFLPLHGEHQASNAAVALAAAEAMVGASTAHPLDPDAVRAAFASVAAPGRLEPVQGGQGVPTVLIDAAHNPAGAKALARSLSSEFRFTRLVGVIGVLQGKDARGILTELEPVLHEVVVTTNGSPRAMNPDDLGALATEVFSADRVSVEPLLRAAIEEAGELAEEAGDSGVGVIVTGSVVTAGEARALFGKEPA